MNPTIIAIVLSLTTISFVTAQNAQPITPAINTANYDMAIGLRGGGTSGLTIKKFTSANQSWEAIIGGFPGGISATLLKQFYAPAGATGLTWYYGYGGHAVVGGGKRVYTNNGDVFFVRQGGFGIGVDGIVGLEYKIIPIPFAINFDLKPFVEVNTNGAAIVAFDPGLGIKFTF